MYFLMAAIAGMKRRWISTLLVCIGGIALLSSASAIGLWSFWLGQSQANSSLQRSVSAYIESTDETHVALVISESQKIAGIQSARAVTPKEFSGYLQTHFPSLATMLTELGEDVIPRFVEFRIPAGLAPSDRSEILADIQSLPHVGRVDDSYVRVEKALHSIEWLSVSGLGLAMGLWFVLFILCLGHYQNILHNEKTEMQLLRSFGASKISLLTPWMIEAFLQSLLTTVFAISSLLLAKGALFHAYNDFYGTIGFEPLPFSYNFIPTAFIGVMGLALLAHFLGGVLAFSKVRL